MSFSLRVEDGSIDPKREMLAKRLANAQQTAIAAAVDRNVFRAPVNTHSLRQGVDIAIPPVGDGVYLGRDRFRADAKRYVDLVIARLGEDRLWEALHPMDITRMAKGWATDRERGLTVRQETGECPLVPGLRCLELGISTLEKCAEWLENNGFMPKGTYVRHSDWKAEVRRDWLNTVKHESRLPQPRHTPKDVARLLEPTDAIDPRFVLAFELGAELRVGQLISMCRRSDLHLAGDDFNPFGTLTVPQAGSKPGVGIGLTAGQRQRIDQTLSSGFLSDYERAMQCGTIDDYPLFPGGRLRDGIVPVRRPSRPWNRRTALKHFHLLEKASGIEPVKGRGWNGVRRVFADVIPKVTDDDVLAAQLGAHSKETRDRLYRNRIDPELLSRARTIRSEIRGGLTDSCGQGEPHS